MVVYFVAIKDLRPGIGTVRRCVGAAKQRSTGHHFLCTHDLRNPGIQERFFVGGSGAKLGADISPVQNGDTIMKPEA